MNFVKLRYSAPAIILAASMCISMCSCSLRKYDPERDYVSPLKRSEDQPMSSSEIYDMTDSVDGTDLEDDTSSVSSDSDSSEATSGRSESSKSSSAKVTSSKVTSSKSASSRSSSSKSASSKTTSSGSNAVSSKASSSSVKTSSSQTRPAAVTTETEIETDVESSKPEKTTSSSVSSKTSEPVPSSEPEPLPEPEPEPVSEPSKPSTKDGRKLVVIDAGHQSSANLQQEPIAPGSSQTKIKVSGGTQGVATGKPEYELTLELALRLQPILEERGYEVVQIRTSSDVNISNVERAQIANELGADVFIRIHANGSDNSAVSGAMTLCQTSSNPYNGDLYYESRLLSGYILDELCSSAGCNKEYVWETDTMTGINWAQVPVSIVEVGYMTNPNEDRLLSQEDYQDKICVGIANGIDLYMSEIGEY